jgi:hypothetical protein
MVIGYIFSDFLLLAAATMTKQKGSWQSTFVVERNTSVLPVSVLPAFAELTGGGGPMERNTTQM